jgi:hypothetical protein
MSPFEAHLFRFLLRAFFVGGWLFPILLLWGWVRWIRSPKSVTVSSLLSLTGLVLVSASALCAAGLFSFARSLGGGLEHFDNPLFMGIFSWGKLLARIALILGMVSFWRPSPTRWQTLASSFAILIFWTLIGGD